MSTFSDVFWAFLVVKIIEKIYDRYIDTHFERGLDHVEKGFKVVKNNNKEEKDTE